MRAAAGFAAIAVLTVMLSGCAVMNTSVQETAETLDAGHFKMGAEYNLGMDLTTAVYLEDATEGEFTADAVAAMECYGVKIGFGLTDRLEVDAKLWASIGGMGTKLYTKYRLPFEGAHTSWALAPGLTSLTTESDDDDEGSLEEYIADVTSFGFEVPLMVTYRWNESVSVTGTARYGLDFIEITYPEGSTLEEYNDTYALHRLGVISTWSFEAGALYLRPELGAEMAFQVNGDPGVVPVIAVGAGLEF